MSLHITPQFIIYVTIILLMLGAILWHIRHNFWRTMYNISRWLLICSFLLAGYAYQKELSVIWQRMLWEINPNAVMQIEEELYYKKARDGHFHILVAINGVPIEFLLDTGATDVSMNMQDAARCGIDVNALQYNKQYRTANGVVKGADAKVSITIANRTFNNFTINVNSGEMDGGLLGMSFLSLFPEVEMTGEQLKIKLPPLQE